jgi:hypothetical protein
MASNLVEYLYHPDVYKTTPCPRDQQPGQVCQGRWCPYLHEGEDVACLGPVRNLPILVPLEENFCERIPEAEELKVVLRGDPALLRTTYAA